MLFLYCLGQIKFFSTFPPLIQIYKQWSVANIWQVMKCQFPFMLQPG